MRYVELMKENFALTCCRNRASQTQTVGRTNIVNRLPVSIPEATTSPGQNGFRRLRRWRTLSGLNQPILAMKPKDKTSNNILYVKFSYLPEDGMVKVGSKTVSFGRILEKMQQSNRTLRR
ncbi:hypothetical protein H9U85_000752 [Salmonella enterica]|nr:hypothetical protein [Salmonella enterica]EFU1369708.1 hypothetical protein [Salmonella enterica subsp. enterica serovar Javiana]UES31045.1 hypothetical protein LE45_11525 [Salmonella enterica subsp. enterica]EEB2150110.1 hypothetical protein [Salmonella enterica]EEG9836761.1 hypothetical protein [Salmonella enterica]